jgi:hypothetical protein
LDLSLWGVSNEQGRDAVAAEKEVNQSTRLTDIFISILPMGLYPSTTKSSYVNPSMLPISSAERLKRRVGKARGSRSSWILRLRI